MYLVLSDTHIGDKRTVRHMDRLLYVLDQYAGPDCTLVLNGDAFDFARHPHFRKPHRLFLKATQGFKETIYIEGNHDWFISGLGDALPGITCCRRLRLEGTGVRIEILHGDQQEKMSRSFMGHVIVKMNHALELATGIDLQRALQRTAVFQWYHAKQEKRLLEGQGWGNVLVAGHTHRPGIRHIGDRTYVNTGAWIEKSHCHYLLIGDDGSLDLRPAYE